MVDLRNAYPPMSLAEIAAHHATLESSIHLYYSPENPKYEAIFPFDTQSEIRAMRDESLYEVRASSAFNVLAWIEATFQSDYRQRVYLRRRDALSRAYYRLYRKSDCEYRFQTISFIYGEILRVFQLTLSALSVARSNTEIGSHTVAIGRSISTKPTISKLYTT